MNDFVTVPAIGDYLGLHYTPIGPWPCSARAVCRGRLGAVDGSATRFQLAPYNGKRPPWRIYYCKRKYSGF
jgi:hypothetical protein